MPPGVTTPRVCPSRSSLTNRPGNRPTKQVQWSLQDGASRSDQALEGRSYIYANE